MPSVKEKLLNKDWRLDHIYTIVDKQSQRVRFKRNAIQRTISDNPARRKMILKARQFGVSTSCLIEMLDAVLTTENLNACIVAHEKDSIQKLFRIVQRAYKFLPDMFKPELDRGGGSKYEMFFPALNSRIYCDLESRGDTIHWLHVSELAFCKNTDRLDSTLQAVPLNGRVTIETTPNGMGNFFFDMWMDSNSTYERLFFPWFLHEEYKLEARAIKYSREENAFIQEAKKRYNVSITPEQIAFRRFKMAELKAKFSQEYPEDDQTCFLSSGAAVISASVINEKLKFSNDPINDDPNLRIYEPYDNSQMYVCGADVAEGVGRDYSVAVVMNVYTKKVAAVLRGRFKPSEFAERLFNLCNSYVSGGRMHPLLGVERNNHGHAVLLRLDQLGYPNLYHAKDERPGWHTNLVTRPIMINAFIDAIENSEITCDDKNILSECLTLIDNNGKIEAADGKHDDCVVACAIAIQMLISNSSLEVYNDLEHKIYV